MNDAVVVRVDLGCVVDVWGGLRVIGHAIVGLPGILLTRGVLGALSPGLRGILRWPL